MFKNNFHKKLSASMALAVMFLFPSCDTAMAIMEGMAGVGGSMTGSSSYTSGYSYGGSSSGEWHSCSSCGGSGSCRSCGGSGKSSARDGKCHACDRTGNGKCAGCKGKGGWYV